MELLNGSLCLQNKNGLELILENKKGGVSILKLNTPLKMLEPKF